MRDLYHNIGTNGSTPALNVQAISSATTTNGNIIDLQGFESATFVVASGALTAGTFTAQLQEGDVANLSDAGTVAAGNLIGTLPAITTANTVARVGYKGGKRYVRLNVITTGESVSGTVGGVAVLGDAHSNPVT